MKNGITWKNEFPEALRRYLPHTKRTLAEIINQKGYAINRTANAITAKADAKRLEAEIGPEAQSKAIPNAPALAVIINAKRGKGKGLYGSEMRAAVEKEWRRRKAAINFLRAGFLPGVAAFARSLGKAVGRNASRWAAVHGMGGATPARPGVKVEATFFNAAVELAPKSSRPDAAAAKAEAGLERASAQEIASMDKYIERKMQQETDRVLGRLMR